MTINFGLSRYGQAGFIFLSMQYPKNAPFIRKMLIKKNMIFKLILEATDFDPPTLLYFRNKTIDVYAVTKEFAADKSQWDGKLISTSPILVEYFIGSFGVFRPLLFGKIKTVKTLNLMKLVWFIRVLNKFYRYNKSFARAVFHAFYFKFSLNKKKRSSS